MKRGMEGSARTAFVAIALGVLSACTAPVAAGLDETDANHVVVALEQAGIAAEKQADPRTDGRWQVVVGHDDAAAALTVLTEEDLPPPSTPGVLDALGESSIVPSRAAEHARLIAGTAGELERSLRDVSGVVSARVHLAVPPKDPLAVERDEEKATASVLLRYRGATPPIADDDLRLLVAGAVAGLDREDVAVVTTPAPPRERLPERELARLGPVTTTRASVPWARLIGAAVVTALLALGATVVLLWTRVRRLRQRAGDLEELQDAS